MALSAITIRRLSAAGRSANHVQTAEVVYKGGFLSLGSEDHATAAKTGRAYAYGDENGSIFWGLMTSGGGSGSSQGADTVTGDSTSATTLDNNMVAAIQEAFQIDAVAVTGSTAKTDAGKWVYATDDDTLTLTRPTVGCPIGFVLEWRSGTSCRVQIFSVETVMAFVAGGCGQHRMALGTYTAASIVDGDLVTTLPMIHSGRIVAFHIITHIAAAGTGGTTTLNLEVGTTNVGPTAATPVVYATGTQAISDVTSSAAISVNNKFSEGETLSVEAASSVTFTAGSFSLFVDYITGPGL